MNAMKPLKQVRQEIEGKKKLSTFKIEIVLDRIKEDHSIIIPE